MRECVELNTSIPHLVCNLSNLTYEVKCAAVKDDVQSKNTEIKQTYDQLMRFLSEQIQILVSLCQYHVVACHRELKLLDMCCRSYA